MRRLCGRPQSISHMSIPKIGLEIASPNGPPHSPHIASPQQLTKCRMLVWQEENKRLADDNLILTEEVSTLRAAMQSKDEVSSELQRRMAAFQAALEARESGLRDEVRLHVRDMPASRTCQCPFCQRRAGKSSNQTSTP